MTSILKSCFSLTVSIALLSSISITTQAASNDLADLVGVRASSGELALQSRGYEFVKSQKGDDRVWSYWYQPSTNSCVTVAVYDGRYDAITDSPTDCGEPYIPQNQQSKGQGKLTLDDIDSLVGARAAGAENVLIQNGYQDVRGYTGSKTRGVLWWNPVHQDCLNAVTSNGRIKSITHFDKKLCK